MKKSQQNWYKNSFEQMNVTPPEEVWNDIASKLSELEIKDEQRKRNHTIYFFLGSVPVMVSLIALSVFQFQTKSILTTFGFSVLNNSDYSIDSKQLLASTNDEATMNSVNNNSTNIPVALVNNFPTVQHAISSQVDHNTTALSEYSSGNFSIETVEAKSSRPELLKPNSVYPKYLFTGKPIGIIHAKSERKKSFYIGAGGYAINSWLLNNHTKEGFDNYSLVDNKMSVTLNPVVQFGYNPNGKNFIQAEIMPEVIRQRNNYFAEGKYNMEETSIRYTRYNLQLGLLINHKDADCHFHIMPGLFAANMISSQKITTSDDLQQVNYKKLSVGAEVSFLATVKLSDNFNLSAGIKASSGINNINKGSSTSPGYLDPTHNFSLSAGLSLKYFIK